MDRELELILSGFEKNFRELKGRNTALFEGLYESEIWDTFSGKYGFSFIISTERKTGGHVKNIADVDFSSLDAVILADHRGCGNPDYRAVEQKCRENSVRIYELFGFDMIKLIDELNSQEYMNLYQWKELLRDYDTVSFTIIHTFMNESGLFPGEFSVNSVFLDLYRWLKSEGKRVCFFYRKSFGTDEQKKMLTEAGVDFSDGFIQRRERDLGFRKLREMYPDDRIMHIGNSEAEDGIIPRFYGIDTFLYRYERLERKESVKRERNVKREYPSRDKLEELIDSHDVISFDLFDTLLLRPLHEPEDLFSVMEERYALRDFKRRRMTCPEMLNNPVLSDIYASYTGSFGEDAKEGKSLEYAEAELEYDLIRPRKSMRSLYRKALSAGRTIVFTTDMYLTKDILEPILEKNGYGSYSSLYISSEYGRRKEEGLFEVLIDDWKDKSILHIGDDVYADVKCASDAGIDAFHVPSVRELAGEWGLDEVHEMCTNSNELMLLGLVECEAFDSPFEAPSDIDSFALLLFAPMNIGYLTFTREYFRENACDMFLLSGRDGWSIIDAMKVLHERFEDYPDFRYFEVSRHAAFLLAADDIKRAGYFDTFYKNLDSRTILENVYGFKGEDYAFDDSLTLKENLENNLLLLSRISSDSRKGLLEYLRSLGVRDEDRLCLMDFISSGTVLGFLNHFLKKEIKGLFYARPDYQAVRNEHILTYLDGDEGFDFSSLLDIEVFMSSPAASIDRYSSDGSRVHLGEVRDGETIKLIERVQERAAALMTYYLEKLYDGKKEINEKIVRKLLKMAEGTVPSTVTFDDWIGEKI